MALFASDGDSRAEDMGELCLSGSQVSDGYWEAPELTAHRFFEAEGQRWYRTGDLASYDPALGFIYRGRTDHQVKLRGYRVELQEIEAAVRAATRCDLAAVVPWPLGPEGGALGCVAFVPELRGAESDALAECARSLPDYMVPSRIVAVGTMPLNANGKVDHVALRQHPALTNS